MPAKKKRLDLAPADFDPFEIAMSAIAPAEIDAFAILGWEAQPKQALAEQLSHEADELLFGGAAGGGKSEWLIHHGIAEMMKHPRNRGVIFRRNMPSLQRSLIPRSRAILEGVAHWNGQENTWTFPNKSVLEFAHMQHDDTVHRYQGAEYGFVGFEEITEFYESQWEYLLTRLRAPADGIRPHAVGTTNPGGVGHAWVKARWVKPNRGKVGPIADEVEPCKIWAPESTEDNPEPLTRVFIPSTLADNPKLTERDPKYRARLRGMATSRGMRLALEQGDWDAIEIVPGALWTPEIIKVDGNVPPLVRIVIGVDPSGGDGANSDEQGIVVCGKDYQGNGWVLADRSCSLSPKGWAQRAVAAYQEFQADEIVAEVNFGGAMVIETINAADPTIPVRAITASRGKRQRAEPVALRYEEDRVRHARDFPALVHQMCSWVPEHANKSGVRSPDRMDALVWAMSVLIPTGQGHAFLSAWRAMAERDGIVVAESPRLELVHRRMIEATSSEVDPLELVS